MCIRDSMCRADTSHVMNCVTAEQCNITKQSREDCLHEVKYFRIWQIFSSTSCHRGDCVVLTINSPVMTAVRWRVVTLAKYTSSSSANCQHFSFCTLNSEARISEHDKHLTALKTTVIS